MRRHLARRLNKETKGGRHEPMDVKKWLSRPNQTMTRGEGYALLRQYHYEVERSRWKRNPFILVPVALFLIITFPFRWGWKGLRALWAKRGED